MLSCYSFLAVVQAISAQGGDQAAHASVDSRSGEQATGGEGLGVQARIQSLRC